MGSTLISITGPSILFWKFFVKSTLLRLCLLAPVSLSVYNVFPKSDLTCFGQVMAEWH